MRAIGGNIKNIRTAVFYRWNKFFPKIKTRNLDDLEELKSIFYKDYCSTEVFYLSEDSNSDFLDFAEYGFKFDPEKKDGKSTVITNYFSQDTIKLATDESTGKLDFTKINYLNNYMFPSSTTEEDIVNKDNYFGMFSSNSFNVIFLKLPSEEIDSLGSKLNGVWKVELYNDYIKFNNDSSEYPFIDYNVLSEFKEVKEEILESLGLVNYENNSNIVKPGLTLEFGPARNSLENLEEDVRSYFYYQDDQLGRYDYSDIIGNEINESKWIDLCREISSGKLLSIMISPDNSIESINFSKIAWETSKNPNRNQSDYALRNDRFKCTRDSIRSISKIGSNLSIDSNSGVLVSTKNLGVVDVYGTTANLAVPIISAKAKRLKYKYSKYKVYSEGDAVSYNGGLYISLVSGNCGECPMFSKYWKYFKKYTGSTSDEESDLNKYISDKLGSLKLLNDSLTSDYIYYNIETNNKLCIISPSGNVSVRPNKNSINPRVTIIDFDIPADLKVREITKKDDKKNRYAYIEVYDNGKKEVNTSFTAKLKFTENSGEKKGKFYLEEPPKSSFVGYNYSLNRTVRFIFEKDSVGLLFMNGVILYKDKYNPYNIPLIDETSNLGIKRVSDTNSLEIMRDSETTNIQIKAFYLDDVQTRIYLSLSVGADSEKTLFSLDNLEDIISNKDNINIFLEITEVSVSPYELTRLQRLGVTESENIDLNITNKDKILAITGKNPSELTSKFQISLVMKEHECVIKEISEGLECSSFGSYVKDNSSYSFELYSNYIDRPWQIRFMPIVNSVEAVQMPISRAEDLNVVYVSNNIINLSNIGASTRISLKSGSSESHPADIYLKVSDDGNYKVALSNIRTSFNIYLEYKENKDI